MTQFAFAARSQVRNALLCTLATLTLAACGSEAGSSAAAATSTDSDSVASMVSPNVGMIDRSQGIDDAPGSSGILGTAGASNGASSTGATGTGTANTGTGTSAGGTASGGTSAGTGSSGTVASNKPTPPVKSTPVKTTTGVATLDWMPPTENSDGSVLTNLAGYTVYYGTSPNNLTQSIKVTNPGLTAYTLSNLTSGTWYFAVTSYSSDGVESTRSSTISTTI